MKTLRVWLARLRDFRRRGQIEADLRQEIASHLDEATEELVRQGLSPADARAAALRSFGGVAQTEDAYREGLSFRWLEQARRDVRHSARALVRSPGFTSSVLVVIAIGTAAIVSVFALLDAIVLRPLPFAQADQLVAITHSSPTQAIRGAGISSGLYFYYQEHAGSLQSIGVYEQRVLNLKLPDSATERVQVTSANAPLLRMLGVAPELGRLFTDEDGRPGFMNTNWLIPILVSHDFWVHRLGGDPGVLNRQLTINDNARVIVGVMPDTFTFPDAHTEIWMLTEPPRVTANFAQALNWRAVGRLRPGVTAAAAQAELTSLLPRIEGVYSDATAERLNELKLAASVVPLKSAVIGDVSEVLWTLFGGMTCLLVIACANASTLFAMRADHRRREIAVRLALGASRREIGRLFFIEALVLTTVAAGIGVLLAGGILREVIARVPVELPRTTEVALDGSAAAFASTLAVLVAAFYATLSVRRHGWSVPASALLTGDRTTADRARRLGLDPIVAIQTALALALMIGSALMVKTYLGLSARPLGFTPDHALTADVVLPYRLAGRHARIYRELVDRVRGLPGVDDATVASFAPLTPAEQIYPVQAGGTPIPFKFFVPGYFQALHTPIAQGQSFAAGEDVTAPSPVLVSAALARRLFPGASAIGQTVSRLNHDGTPVTLRGPVPPFTIVGIVGDVRETALRDDPAEIVYIPMIEPAVERSIVPTNVTLIVRTQGDPLALSQTVREAIAGVDPGLAVSNVRTLDAIVAAARGRETFVGALLLIAAGVSLLLGGVGIYGSVAHAVRHRTREIGVRVALGASRADVVRMVVAGSMRAVGVGALVGLALSLWGAGLLRALLFDVAPRDPLSFVLVTGVLLIAAATAALLGSRRAARIAPVVAMRVD